MTSEIGPVADQIYEIWNGTIFSQIFFNEKFRLIDWRWSVWRAGGVHN